MTTPASNGQIDLREGKLALLVAWYEDLPHAKRRQFWQIRGTMAVKIAWLMSESMQLKMDRGEMIQ